MRKPRDEEQAAFEKNKHKLTWLQSKCRSAQRLTTWDGRKAAVEALWERRRNKPVPVSNGSLWAGSPMYFYCISCGHPSDVLPESYTSTPRKLCKECQALKDLGWLDE